jgi:hypothetical protein
MPNPITENRSNLIDNWENRETLEGIIPLRVFDPRSEWECYIIAQDPDDEDCVYCMICDSSVELQEININDLMNQTNHRGDHLEVDPYFRPVKASSLFRKLQKTKGVIWT